METIRVLKDRPIVLGVTGSIAAYKAVELASQLTQAGAQVTVVMTEAATRFVAPLTFQAVTGQPVYTDLWTLEHHIPHVGLAQNAALLVIAPATANFIGKLANGLADDLLSVTALAARCPLLIAPAMDAGMYTHPAVTANLKTLADRGVHIAGPAYGRMASGLIGLGRMVEPEALLGQIRYLLSRGGPLAGRRVVVTAGGTREPLDPVRFLSNRSSGRQGFALAQAALDYGAEVTLITAPVALETPWGAQRIDVQTAEEMRQAVLAAIADADVLLMAAAVADWRPAETSAHKLKRREAESRTLRLVPTPDILAAVAGVRERSGRPAVVVGFAAETRDLIAHAQEKLLSKRLDLIAANDVLAADSGFEVTTNRVTLLDAQGGIQPLELLTKAEVAERILERVHLLLAEATRPPVALANKTKLEKPSF